MLEKLLQKLKKDKESIEHINALKLYDLNVWLYEILNWLVNRYGIETLPYFEIIHNQAFIKGSDIFIEFFYNSHDETWTTRLCRKNKDQQQHFGIRLDDCESLEIAIKRLNIFLNTKEKQEINV